MKKHCLLSLFTAIVKRIASHTFSAKIFIFKDIFFWKQI